MAITSALSSSLFADGLRFRALVKSDVTLDDGTQTTVITLVPTDMRGGYFEYAVKGVNSGLKSSGRAISVTHDVYSLLPDGTLRLFVHFAPTSMQPTPTQPAEPQPQGCKHAYNSL